MDRIYYIYRAKRGIFGGAEDKGLRHFGCDGDFNFKMGGFLSEMGCSEPSTSVGSLGWAAFCVCTAVE